MSPTVRITTIGLSGLLMLLTAACGTSDNPSSNPPNQTLTVFAAASLQSTFTLLAEDFEAAHPGTTVTFSFAGSSDLATQLTAGAPADVFASADTANMDRVVQEGLIDGDPMDFASNTLVIVVPPSNPAGITGFEDLANPDTRVVLCAPQVPCGSAATKAQEATGKAVNAVSEESSVTDVLGKVVAGEADAGLVYITDAAAAGDTVVGIPFTGSEKAVNVYPAGAVSGGNVDLANAFLDLVTSPAGREVLEQAGFGAP